MLKKRIKGKSGEAGGGGVSSSAHALMTEEKEEKQAGKAQSQHGTKPMASPVGIEPTTSP